MVSRNKEDESIKVVDMDEGASYGDLAAMSEKDWNCDLGLY